MKTKYDFQERMARAKDAAASERHLDKHGGGSTVRVFRTTTEMYSYIGRADHSNFDAWLIEVRGRVADAMESTRHAIADRREREQTGHPFQIWGE